MEIPIENIIPNAVPTTKSALQALAKEAAIKHGLNVSRFLAVIECESSWDTNAKGDYRKGEPTSFGLAQLHYPTRDWGIATSSAYVPEIALTLMAEAWVKNKQHKWSCYNILYG